MLHCSLHRIRFNSHSTTNVVVVGSVITRERERVESREAHFMLQSALNTLDMAVVFFHLLRNGRPSINSVAHCCCGRECRNDPGSSNFCCRCVGRSKTATSFGCCCCFMMMMMMEAYVTCGLTASLPHNCCDSLMRRQS